MGVPVARTTIAIYTLSSVLAGLAVVFSLHPAGYSLSALGVELDAIAAVVIGGTLSDRGLRLCCGHVHWRHAARIGANLHRLRWNPVELVDQDCRRRAFVYVHRVATACFQGPRATKNLNTWTYKMSEPGSLIRTLSGRPPARNFHSYVINEVGRAIVSGDMPVGSNLPGDAEMMMRFGVSRTVLREALKTLEAKGLSKPAPKSVHGFCHSHAGTFLTVRCWAGRLRAGRRPPSCGPFWSCAAAWRFRPPGWRLSTARTRLCACCTTG